MIKKVFLIIIILCFGIGISKNLYAQTHREKTDSTQNTGIDTSSNIITDVDTVHSTSTDQSQPEITEHSDTDMHEDEHHGGMEPLFFIIIALVIGAATRHFFRKIPLPFTVLLLLFGIGLGLLNRFGLFEGWGDQSIDTQIAYITTYIDDLLTSNWTYNDELKGILEENF